jgi:hypothetical protein
MFMRQIVRGVGGLLLVLAGCSTAPHGSTASQGRFAPVELNPAPEPYVRVLNLNSNKVELQIAVRRFVPTDGGLRGPVVWLTGVSHIGETNYFEALQRHLDAQSLVLFEGVGEHGPGEEVTPAERAAQAQEKGNESSLQSTMASSLGLEFQLEAIDYTSLRFRNSDLTIGQLRELMGREEKTNAPGGAGAAQTFESLLGMMQGGTWLDTLMQFGMRVLGSDARLRALSKLALIEMFGQMQGDPAQLRGLPPDLKQLLAVLIQQRNQKVLSDLKGELGKNPGPASVALFYGTGHMPDLERGLRGQLKYRPAGEEWYTALSVDLARTGITPGERQFIHAFIQRELEQLQARP